MTTGLNTTRFSLSSKSSSIEYLQTIILAWSQTSWYVGSFWKTTIFSKPFLGEEPSPASISATFVPQLSTGIWNSTVVKLPFGWINLFNQSKPLDSLQIMFDLRFLFKFWCFMSCLEIKVYEFRLFSNA